MADTFNQDPYNLTSDPLTGGGTYGEGRISDALQRLRGLQGALRSGQIDYGTYNKLFQQFDPQAQQLVQGIAGGGSKSASAANNAGAVTFNQLSQEGGTDLNTFAKQYQNLTGKAPSAQEINDYFSNVAPSLGGTNVADQNSLINQFISTQYQPQIQDYQTGKMTSALDAANKKAQDIVNQQNQQTVSQLNSPENVARFKQNYNQGGMLDSGAYAQGLGETLANAASGNMSNALGSIGLSGIQGIENTQNAPYQQFLGGLQPGLNQAGQSQQSGINFGMQSDLAKTIAQMQQPTTLEQWAPVISGGLQGAGSAAATSYICLELIKRGFATEYDLDRLHYEGMPALFKKARAFYFYAKHGKELVEAANRKNIDWKPWTKRFLGDVIGVGNAVEAVNLYALACKDLANLCAPELWDERVMRTSFWDSIPFIPRLFSCKPYVKALIKTIGMRMKMILDMPPMGI